MAPSAHYFVAQLTAGPFFDVGRSTRYAVAIQFRHGALNFDLPLSAVREIVPSHQPVETTIHKRSFIDRMLWNVDRINVCMCGRLPPFPRGLLPRPRYKLGNGKFGCYQLSRSRNSAMMVARFVVMLSTPRA